MSPKRKTKIESIRALPSKLPIPIPKKKFKNALSNFMTNENFVSSTPVRKTETNTSKAKFDCSIITTGLIDLSRCSVSPISKSSNENEALMSDVKKISTAYMVICSSDDDIFPSSKNKKTNHKMTTRKTPLVSSSNEAPITLNSKTKKNLTIKTRNKSRAKIINSNVPTAAFNKKIKANDLKDVVKKNLRNNTKSYKDQIEDQFSTFTSSSIHSNLIINAKNIAASKKNKEKNLTNKTRKKSREKIINDFKDSNVPTVAFNKKIKANDNLKDVVKKNLRYNTKSYKDQIEDQLSTFTNSSINSNLITNAKNNATSKNTKEKNLVKNPRKRSRAKIINEAQSSDVPVAFNKKIEVNDNLKDVVKKKLQSYGAIKSKQLLNNIGTKTSTKKSNKIVQIASEQINTNRKRDTSTIKFKENKSSDAKYIKITEKNKQQNTKQMHSSSDSTKRKHMKNIRPRKTLESIKNSTDNLAVVRRSSRIKFYTNPYWIGNSVLRPKQQID